MEALIGEYVPQRPCVLRICRAFVLEEVSVVTLLEVDVIRRDLPLLIDEHGDTLTVDPCEGDREEGTGRITLLGEAITTDELDHTTLVVELRDLGVGVGVDEARRPREVLGADIGRGDAELHTVGLHLCHVSRANDRTTDPLSDHGTHLVEVVTGVDIEGEVQTIIPETSVDTEVQLVLLLIGQIDITQLLDGDPGFLVLGEELEGCRRLEDRGRIAIRSIRRRPRKAIRETSRQVRERTETLEEALLMYVPGT